MYLFSLVLEVENLLITYSLTIILANVSKHNSETVWIINLSLRLINIKDIMKKNYHEYMSSQEKMKKKRGKY